MALSRALATAAEGGLAGLALYQVQRADRDPGVYSSSRALSQAAISSRQAWSIACGMSYSL